MVVGVATDGIFIYCCNYYTLCFHCCYTLSQQPSQHTHRDHHHHFSWSSWCQEEKIWQYNPPISRLLFIISFSVSIACLFQLSLSENEGILRQQQWTVNQFVYHRVYRYNTHEPTERWIYRLVEKQPGTRAVFHFISAIVTEREFNS